MNIEKLKTAWYPLFPSHKLTNKPQGVELLGQKLVLARLEGVAVCFDDCCPHRHFPLSEGKIVADKLECGYHGWQFDTLGVVCKLSGGLCDNANNIKANVKKFPCYEQDDWIWVNLTDNIAFETFADFATPVGFESINAQKSMIGDLIHVIENLLDPTHTAYIHRGILRNNGTQAMKIKQTHNSNGFSTHYELVQQQNGLINRLFDKGITVNLAKFTFPSLTCIDYFTPTSHEYRVSVFFIPQSIGKLRLNIRIHLPKDKIPLKIKSLILQPFLELILHQDKIAVAKQYRNQRFLKQDFVNTNNDLVIEHLLHLLANAPEGVDKSGVMTLE